MATKKQLQAQAVTAVSELLAAAEAELADMRRQLELVQADVGRHEDAEAALRAELEQSREEVARLRAHNEELLEP